MRLVDVHCHLDHDRYDDDLLAVLSRAEAAGVKAIITQGVSHEANAKLLELAKKSSLIKVAMGLYPSFAANVEPVFEYEDEYTCRSRASVDDTLAFIKKHKADIMAIGEVGLDLQELDSLEPQLTNFKKVIALAKEINKPLIIHTRKAEEQVLDALEESKIPARLVLLHCFCGKKKYVERAAKLGYSFSIPGVITRAQNFQLLVAKVPLRQLFTETDGPYLVADKSFEKSESAHVIYAINKIAEIKGMTPEEVSDNIFMNYQRMFL